MDGRQAPGGSGAGTRLAAWCLLLVLPLWLVGVAVTGYGKDCGCTSDRIEDAALRHRPRPTPLRRRRSPGVLGPLAGEPLSNLVAPAVVDRVVPVAAPRACGWPAWPGAGLRSQWLGEGPAGPARPRIRQDDPGRLRHLFPDEEDRTRDALYAELRRPVVRWSELGDGGRLSPGMHVLVDESRRRSM